MGNVAPGQSVISFDQLFATRVEQTFAWVNPDSSSEKIRFEQMPIPVDKQMKDMTQRFMLDNYGRNSIWVEPRMIVIHSMDLEDLQTSLQQSSFLDRRMPGTWTTVVKAGSLPSGAHFIIDRDGTIYCLTPPWSTDDDTGISYNRDRHRWFIRRHVDANPMAIGIENVTLRNGSFDDLTSAQVASNAKLVRWLLWMEKGAITHVVSHHQFNDTTQYEAMLKEFSIELPRPMYRAWTRKDVGDGVLGQILDKVRRKGWNVREQF